MPIIKPPYTIQLCLAGNVTDSILLAAGIISENERNIITPAENPNPTDNAFKLSFLKTKAKTEPIAVAKPANRVTNKAIKYEWGIFKSFQLTLL